MPADWLRIAEQIAASPEDRELQKVFADALLEAGGDHAIRGELIQLELDGKYGARQLELADALLRIRQARGLGGVGIREGFARRWICSVEELQRHASVVFAEEPLLTRLLLSVSGAGSLRALARIPALARIRDLTITTTDARESRPGPDGLAALLASPHLARLHELALSDCALGDAGVAMLAQAEVLSELRVLSVANNEVTAVGVAALAQSRVLRRLRFLSLWGNTIDDAAIDALASPHNRLPLEVLDLNRTQMTAERVAPLVARFPQAEIRYSLYMNRPELDPAPEEEVEEDTTFTKGPFV